MWWETQRILGIYSTVSSSTFCDELNIKHRLTTSLGTQVQLLVEVKNQFSKVAETLWIGAFRHKESKVSLGMLKKTNKQKANRFQSLLLLFSCVTHPEVHFLKTLGNVSRTFLSRISASTNWANGVQAGSGWVYLTKWRVRVKLQLRGGLRGVSVLLKTSRLWGLISNTVMLHIPTHDTNLMHGECSIKFYLSW